MEIINSKDNKQVKAWNSLHRKKYRDEAGLFLVEGEHLIQEALAADAVETILYVDDCPFSFPKKVQLSLPVMEKLTANPSGTKLMAVCRMIQMHPKKHQRLLLLDGIQDPGNLGTLIRTAVSFGFDGVYCSKTCVDLYNEKTIRSTQGALFHIPVIRMELNDLVYALQKEDVCVVATTLEDASPMEEVTSKEKMAFVLGNEGQGVSKYLQEHADERMRIEMNGFESLNVAVAGGIIMYRYRQ